MISSLRWKTNVQPFRGGLDLITWLKPISYDWKEGGQPNIGLGGEDVAKVAPSLTFSNDQGEISGVKYERLNMLLINAVTALLLLGVIGLEIWQILQARRVGTAGARLHIHRGGDVGVVGEHRPRVRERARQALCEHR